MPRVQNIGAPTPGRTPTATEGSVAAPGTGFRQQLLAARLGALNQQIDRHLAEIERLGQRLANGGDLVDLHRYRDAIRDFFREVTGQAVQVRQEMDWDSQTWEHRTMVILQKVDKQLDELAEIVHSREKDRLAILERTGLIQGLLLDIRI
jgi:uncharacterized protein YaaR (DUF327 family)